MIITTTPSQTNEKQTWAVYIPKIEIQGWLWEGVATMEGHQWNGKCNSKDRNRKACSVLIVGRAFILQQNVSFSACCLAPVQSELWTWHFYFFTGCASAFHLTKHGSPRIHEVDIVQFTSSAQHCLSVHFMFPLLSYTTFCPALSLIIHNSPNC